MDIFPKSRERSECALVGSFEKEMYIHVEGSLTSVDCRELLEYANLAYHFGQKKSYICCKGTSAGYREVFARVLVKVRFARKS